MQCKISFPLSDGSEKEFAQFKQSFGHSYIYLKFFFYIKHRLYIYSMLKSSQKKWLSSHTQHVGFSPQIYNRNIRQDNATANLKQAKKILLNNHSPNQNEIKEV